MSTNSFGGTISEWNMNNPEYQANWEYSPGDVVFNVKVERKPGYERFSGSDISTKASIPDTFGLTTNTVELVLNVLETQLSLFEKYGIVI